MNKFEKTYCNILNKCLQKGDLINSRNGETLQLIGESIKVDVTKFLPVVTGKKIYPKTCFYETEWIIKGETSNTWLNNKGVHIWDKWADENNNLGPIYGKQLRNFNGFDQLKNLVEKAKNNIYDRRLICNLWNPNDIGKMALPPCHYSFQFIATNNFFDIVVTMRSLDLFIGLPYDILMYSIILKSFCAEIGYEARNVIINIASAHIYKEHIESVKKYINAKKYSPPKLLEVPKILNFDSEKIKISEYICGERIIVDVKK